MLMPRKRGVKRLRLNFENRKEFCHGAVLGIAFAAFVAVVVTDTVQQRRHNLSKDR
jgi:hypothetical protein